MKDFPKYLLYMFWYLEPRTAPSGMISRWSCVWSSAVYRWRSRTCPSNCKRGLEFGRGKAGAMGSSKAAQKIRQTRRRWRATEMASMAEEGPAQDKRIRVPKTGAERN